jgi:hypothetical protein
MNGAYVYIMKTKLICSEKIQVYNATIENRNRNDKQGGVMTTEQKRIIENLHKSGDKLTRLARKTYQQYDDGLNDNLLELSEKQYSDGCEYHRQACEMYHELQKQVIV